MRPPSLRRLLAVLATTALSFASSAQAVLTINTPWIRAPSATSPAEAYMELRSSEGAALVGVASEAAPRIAIRPPGKGNAALNELELAAGETRVLAPGSYRLELVRVSHPLKLGEWVPLTLTFRNPDGTEQQMAIRAEVRRRSAIDDHRHMFTH